MPKRPIAFISSMTSSGTLSFSATSFLERNEPLFDEAGDGGDELIEAFFGERHARLLDDEVARGKRELSSGVCRSASR